MGPTTLATGATKLFRGCVPVASFATIARNQCGNARSAGLPTRILNFAFWTLHFVF